MNKNNGKVSLQIKTSIQSKPDVFISLLIGVVSGLVTYYLTKEFPGRWFSFLIGAIALLSFGYVAIRAINIVVENNVMRALVVDHENTQSELKDCLERTDKLIEENKKLSISEAKSKEIVEATTSQKQLATVQSERVEELKRELRITREISGKQEEKIDEMNNQLGLLARAGIIGHLEDMQSPDFNAMLKEHFDDSKIVYIMASRGYTLLGPQIEPFHTLFTTMKKELPIEQKDIRILLANPLFNLERTRRIMDSLSESEHQKVMKTFLSTIEHILDYKKYTRLKLRIYHQTATWRLVIFDDLALLSSYKRVKQLPIYVLRPGVESLYEEFLYHFEKVYEVAEELSTLKEYEQLLKNSHDMLERGECELTLKFREITGI